jgi:hypothetical protein
MANLRKATLSLKARRSGQTVYKRFLAYQCLGIEPEKVKRVPFFGVDLRRIRRLAHPTREPDGTPCAPVGLLDALKLSDDPEGRKVFAAYDSVPQSYRRLLPPEAFCVAAGVSPWRVLEIIAGVEIRWGAQASAIIAGMMLPGVVSKAIERARENDGFKDRELLFRATGLLRGPG